MASEAFHKEMLTRAVEHSRTALDSPEILKPYGAVVVSNWDNKVVGEGCNNMKEHLDPTLHGEVVAIKKACQTLGRVDLKDCTLYSSCEPCSMCVALIWWMHIDKVYYAAKAENIRLKRNKEALFKEVSTPTEERSNYIQMCGSEAESIVNTWNSKH